MISGAKRGIIPPSLDVSKPQGFRYLAAFSLALILYLTEYEPDTLSKGFVSTMDYLYQESDKGPMLPRDDMKWLPFIVMGTISLLYPIYPKLGLEQMLNKLLL